MSAGATTTQAVGLRRLSDDHVPLVTLDVAVSPDRLAEATREVDEALRRPDLQPDMAIIISILLAEFAHAMPGERAPHTLRIEVAGPDNRLTGLSAPAGTPGWPPSSPRVRAVLDHLAARWGTMHENGESLLWLHLPPVGVGAGVGPASALHRAMTQLRQVSGLGEVAAVLADIVAPRIGATWTSLGLRASDGVKLVDSDGVRANPPLPLDADLPITAACRTGRPVLHATPAEVAEQYPRMHARMAGARLQSLAHVPATAGSKTIAVLCFGWTVPAQGSRYRWLLTVLADLVAEAVTRIRTEDEAVQRTSPGEHARLLRSGRVELDLAARSARVAGRPAPVALTGREFAVLLQLLRHAGTPQPRATLLAQVWGPARTDSSVVDVTMSRLRRKLDLPELITVKDVGYLFDPDRGEATRDASVR